MKTKRERIEEMLVREFGPKKAFLLDLFFDIRLAEAGLTPEVSVIETKELHDALERFRDMLREV